MSSSQRRRLSSQVNIGLTELEARAVDRAARTAKVSRAAFARRHLLKAVNIPESTRPKRYRLMSSADLEAVAVLVTELGRASGSAIQLAKSLRKSGLHRYHTEAEGVLAELRRQTADAGSLIERLGDQR